MVNQIIKGYYLFIFRIKVIESIPPSVGTLFESEDDIAFAEIAKPKASIVAFRATGLHYFFKPTFNSTRGKKIPIFLCNDQRFDARRGVTSSAKDNRLFHRIPKFFKNFISADWQNIEYNHGLHFDGSIFTAPFEGMYSFLSTAVYQSFVLSSNLMISPRSNFSEIQCFVNDRIIVSALSNISTVRIINTGCVDAGPILLQTTLHLNAKDKVCIKLNGTFQSLSDPKLTYFEGKLVSAIDE